MNETEVKSTVEISEAIAFEDHRYSYFISKRIIDIFAGILGIIIIIPLAIFVKIAYILNKDYYPIFFKQERIGKDGKSINIYKFRTMIPNADKVLERLMEEDSEIAREYKRYKKLKNDPRITKIGKIFRDTSIDEFPQFINVLKGEMSLVGPRPYLPREKKDMGEYYNVIVKCKPGITGYWQVNGRSGTDFIKRLVLDEYYYQTRGTILDSKIMIKTLVKVFKKEGAE